MKTPVINNLYPKLRAGRIVTLIAYALLLIQLTALNITDEEFGSVARWFMQCVPLLLPLPGIILQHYKSYSWLCFILLLYFTVYVVEIGSPLYAWQDATGLALTVVAFIGAMMTSRWLQHWQYRQAQAAETKS